jgi:hypothetical protein
MGKINHDSSDCILHYMGRVGVIKGSEEALQHKNGFLDRKAYENYSYRSQSTFASARDLIYSIFETYTKKKRERGDYDTADR